MVKYKNLNNVSDEVVKQIPEMPEEVVFQMLNGSPNNDMDRTEREKNPILYGKTQLMTKITIKDPKTNSFVDIGAPMGVENDTVISYRPFLAGANRGIFNGKFSLRKGNVQDEELFQIFWLSPEREGSPFPDRRIKPKFKIVNHKEESAKTVTKVQILKNALNDLSSLTEENIREFAASQNWPETDIDALTAKISDFAKSYPEKYNAIRKDKSTSIKSNIKKAIDKNILVYDPISGDVKIGDSLMTNIAKENRVDYLGSISTFINSAKNGTQIYDGILKQLNG